MSPDKEFNGFKRDPEVKELSPLVKKLLAIKWRITGYTRRLSDPQFHDNRTGLLQDSLVAEKLWYPTADGSYLGYKEADAGEWISYDFRRPQEIKVKYGKPQQLEEGKMFVFDLDRLADSLPDEYTPTCTMDIFDIDELLSLDALPAEQMVTKGYLNKTTYQESFTKANLAEQYQQPLSEMGGIPVYEVTPKGNGLIFVRDPNGKPRTARKGTSSKVKVFDRAPSRKASPAFS